MPNFYNSTEFEQITGVLRPTLRNLKISKKLIPTLHCGKDYYTHDDFYNIEIVNRMGRKGIDLLDALLLFSDGRTMPVIKVDPDKKPPPKPKEPKEKIVIPQEIIEETIDHLDPNKPDLILVQGTPFDMVPIGRIKNYVDPLPNMTRYAMDVWRFVLPDLIELQTINKSDLHSLKDYCMVISQISEMEGLMVDMPYLDAAGKINPLIAAIGKGKSASKALAVALNITSIGRKGLKPIDSSDEDDDMWSNLGVST